jgi:hypothetical protein
MTTRAQLVEVETQLHKLYLKGMLTKESYEEGLAELRSKEVERNRLKQAKLVREVLVDDLKHSVIEGRISSKEFVRALHRIDHESGRFACSRCANGTCWTKT